jgi:hypothetical protein
LLVNLACALWDANPLSKQFSRHYTEADVCALYRGFAKHLTTPFRFICWSEKERDYAEPAIEQRRLVDETPRYGSLTQCYELNEPTIMVGLDTIITGNIDHIARYCLDPVNKPAVPMDPFYPERVCNGVSLVPAGNDWLWREYPGQNDMDWIIDSWKAGRIIAFDDIFPGEIVSYKRHVERQGLDGVRICYFHGERKPHELAHVGWIARHWDFRPEDARRIEAERRFAVHAGYPGA